MSKQSLFVLTILLVAITISTSFARVYSSEALECGPAAALRVCTARCASHGDCQPPMLCCPTKCGGAACLPGVTAQNSVPKSADNQQIPRNKPGGCREASGPWVCSHRCRDDSDCPGPKKCCPGRCDGALSCLPPAL